jgi:hypothetical protein
MRLTGYTLGGCGPMAVSLKLASTRVVSLKLAP